MIENNQCSERVFPNDRWGSFHPHQCEKKAVVERDGKWYCKIHDPIYLGNETNGKHYWSIWIFEGIKGEYHKKER